MNLETQLNILTALCLICLALIIHFLYVVYTLHINMVKLSRELSKFQKVALQYLKMTETKVNG